MSRVDKPGLHVPLQPTSPLVSRLPSGVRSFLVCLGVEHPDAVAGQRETKCEISVLGHVVGIPGAEKVPAAARILKLPGAIGPSHVVEGFHPEVVAGATQWRDQAQARQADENCLEVDHIFGPVEGTDPASTGVPEGKLCLHAADTRIAMGESTERAN